MVDVGLVAFAFALGLGTFFSPCSVALLPAYVAYFAGLGPSDRPRPTGEALAAGSRFASAAAAGILAVFVVFGALIYGLRSIVHIPSRWLGIGLAGVALAVAFAVFVLGVLMLFGGGPRFTPRLRAPTGKSFGAMFGFGALYAFASLGCTLPLFFAVVGQVLLVGPVGGSLLIAAFAIGFAGLMFVGTLLLSVAQDRARRALGRVMPYVKPISGGILILAALYIAYYYLVAAPPV